MNWRQQLEVMSNGELRELCSVLGVFIVDDQSRDELIVSILLLLDDEASLSVGHDNFFAGIGIVLFG